MLLSTLNMTQELHKTAAEPVHDKEQSEAEHKLSSNFLHYTAVMADSKVCLGHSERCARVNKIKRMLESPQETPDENLRVLIKRGPNKEETSLKELEENYASKPEWKVIEGGGVLSVPVEEFRMINPPKPDREGKIKFEEKKGKGAGNQIEKYSIAQTISDLNKNILNKYINDMDLAMAAGKSKSAAESVVTSLLVGSICRS